MTFGLSPSAPRSAGVGVSNFKHFRPPGPVAGAYLADRESRVKIIRGPVGSGKTSVDIFDGISAAANEMPVCRDGQIYFRDAVVGTTYGQLERNLYPSWKFWLPEVPEWTPGSWEGGGGRFATHKIRFKVNRGGKAVVANYEAIFAAIGEVDLEKFVRGFEPSAWYLYEVDQLPEGIIEQAIGRLGRWPARSMLPDGVKWKGYVRAELNAPDIDSWYYRYVEETRPKGVRQYVQPSGLSPRAENVNNLSQSYEELAELNKHKPRWVKRFVKNEYGPSEAGQPVFPEWSDDLFLASKDLVPVPGIPLEAGFDAGLGNPAAVIGQQMPDGQFRALGEVVPGRMSARRFAEQVKLEVAALAELAGVPSLRLSGGFGDETGFLGADKEDGELAWMETVMRELDIVIQPVTNNLLLRLDAVRDELIVENGRPRYLVSRRCKKLRKGFVDGYCYKLEKETQRPGEDAKPHKGPHSHVHDGNQYWLLGKKGRSGVIHGRSSNARRSGDRPGCVVMASDFLGEM